MTGAAACAMRHDPGPVLIRIDVSADRHPISPLIYGTAYASPEQLKALNSPLNRMGGNNTSRYNWKLNADNKGNDWFFESIGDTSDIPGERGDTFIRQTRLGGAEPMLTIPVIGWVARLGDRRAKLASYSVQKYGPQEKTDGYFPDAGNGKAKANGKEITDNDPREANVTSDAAFQQEWVRHLVGTWGLAARGGLRYYLLDNEPGIWHSTHRDVHPVGAKMEEIRDKTLDFATKIRAVDPRATIVGPEEWGWTGYLYSGYDAQWGSEHGWNGAFPDRAAHGGAEMMPWLLDQLHRHDMKVKRRSLDVFSLHFYPQGGEFLGDTSEAMQLRRNRSTRALWDPDYTDETWIKSKVNLIPRMKYWVKSYYPGLQTAITEYNWGAEGHINGATAQADIFGIFGREGLDIATRWTTPDVKTPTFKAMQLYRNYDGRKSTFGDISVRDRAPDPDILSSFAAIRSSDGALTIMLINKTLNGSAKTTLSLDHFIPSGTAHSWQLTAANHIIPLADTPVTGSELTVTLPAQSVTLFVIPKN